MAGLTLDPKLQQSLVTSQLSTIDRGANAIEKQYHLFLNNVNIDPHSAAFRNGSFFGKEILPLLFPMGAAARAPSLAHRLRRLRTFQKALTHLGKTEGQVFKRLEKAFAKINHQLQPQLVPAERRLARRTTEQLELRTLKSHNKTEQAIAKSQKSHDIKHRKINPKKEQREISRIDKMSEGGAQRKGCPRNNIAQNKMAEGARQEIEHKLGRKLKKHEQREFHNAVTGQNFTYQELVEEGLNLFQKK